MGHEINDGAVPSSALLFAARAIMTDNEIHRASLSSKTVVFRDRVSPETTRLTHWKIIFQDKLYHPTEEISLSVFSTVSDVTDESTMTDESYQEKHNKDEYLSPHVASRECNDSLISVARARARALSIFASKSDVLLLAIVPRPVAISLVNVKRLATIDRFSHAAGMIFTLAIFSGISGESSVRKSKSTCITH